MPHHKGPRLLPDFLIGSAGVVCSGSLMFRLPSVSTRRPLRAFGGHVNAERRAHALRKATPKWAEAFLNGIWPLAPGLDRAKLRLE